LPNELKGLHLKGLRSYICAMPTPQLILTSFTLAEFKNIVSECVQAEIQRTASPAVSDSEDEALITIEQAIALFNVSRMTILKWRRKGLIPYYRMARRVYFKKSELLTAMKGNVKQFKKFANGKKENGSV
jgi:excisionase family DNA binding protein